MSIFLHAVCQRCSLQRDNCGFEIQMIMIIEIYFGNLIKKRKNLQEVIFRHKS